MSPVSRIRKRKHMPKGAMQTYWGRGTPPGHDLKVQRGDGRVFSYRNRRPPRWKRALDRILPRVCHGLLVAALLALGAAYMASGYGLVAL